MFIIDLSHFSVSESQFPHPVHTSLDAHRGTMATTASGATETICWETIVAEKREDNEIKIYIAWGFGWMLCEILHPIIGIW
jgi:hypothetical protein